MEALSLFANPTQSLPLKENCVDTCWPPLLCGIFNGPSYLLTLVYMASSSSLVSLP